MARCMSEKVTRKMPMPEQQNESEDDIATLEAADESDTPVSAPRTLSPRAKQMIGLTDSPTIPILIVDADLCIQHITQAARLLFSEYYQIEKKPFFNVFQQSLSLDEIRSLVRALHSADQGFGWSGNLRHKTRSTATLHTTANFVPFFNEDRSLAGHLVYFVDTTDVYKGNLRNTFNGILEAAKLKDNDTGLHNERVSYYCRKMCEYLYDIHKYPQIDPDFIDSIGFLAAMHDVGKIGTPDYILQKPGKLTDLEWEIMREHTINGTFILSSYPDPMAKEIALSHHEWWNGSGYPFKLEGTMIPLAARIVTIADVYDALRMKRTYKSEFTHEETVQRILANKGTQFDPALIEVFTAISDNFNDIWNLLKDSEPPRPDTRDRSKEFSESL
ncbi:MAG: HD domain-containing protein [Spirochaetales bacterium]|nr:HD domain-containing protein [Spirochaetales bacterium]